MFNTQIPPPDIAPTKVKARVTDRNVKVTWKNPDVIFKKVNGYRVSLCFFLNVTVQST